MPVANFALLSMPTKRRLHLVVQSLLRNSPRTATKPATASMRVFKKVCHGLDDGMLVDMFCESVGVDKSIIPHLLQQPHILPPLRQRALVGCLRFGQAQCVGPPGSDGVGLQVYGHRA